MKFTTAENKEDTQTADAQKDKIVEKDFFNVAFGGLCLPERKVKIALEKLRPEKKLFRESLNNNIMITKKQSVDMTRASIERQKANQTT